MPIMTKGVTIALEATDASQSARTRQDAWSPDAAIA
jgi:hypothetical protein